MKVLDLSCSMGHSFEGWFASEDDFQDQRSRALVQCPICDDAVIEKKLSAPRLNLGGSRQAEQSNPSHQSGSASTPPSQSATDLAVPPTPDLPAMRSDADHALHALMRDPQFQTAYMRMAKEVLAKTEDVGKDFAREARKMHYGQSKERAIRGQASAEQTMELIDEGIDVLPLLLPNALKKSLQ